MASYLELAANIAFLPLPLSVVLKCVAISKAMISSLCVLEAMF